MIRNGWRVPAALGAVAASVVLAACGGGSSGGGGELTVLAASSLTEAFPKVAAAFAKANDGARVTFEFAGSDQLATQIQEGAKADVFAAASPKYPKQLAAKGTVETPVSFATNTLVAAVPAGASAVADLAALSKPGTKVVIGAAGVPVGDYTRTVLAALDATEGSGWSAAVMRNVVSEEQSVKSIVAKLTSGDADAGFVYTTDVKAAGASLTAIPIPPAAKPSATYPIAVVSASKHKALAEKWVAFVRSAAGQRILLDAGFGAAPSS